MDRDRWDAPATEEEAHEAEALRQALERGELPAALLALKAAHDPPHLGPLANERLVFQATRFTPQARRGMFVVGAMALAAGMMLVLWPSHPEPGALVRSRSTQVLFDTPFAASGGQSERLDRIMAVRMSDFRDNRYAHWGVR